MSERTLEVVRNEYRAQWRKFDQAVAAGVTGAPLVQIDRKLTRLTYELHALEEAEGFVKEVLDER